MKKKALFFVWTLFISAAARAQYESPPYQPPPEETVVSKQEAKAVVLRVYRYYGILGGGASVPFGGHWGDSSAGFRISPDITFAGGKKVDDTLSYGLETSYSSGHKNKVITDMKVRIFSLTPFLRISSQSGAKNYFAVFGAGVYHWTRLHYTAGGESFSSDSGSSLGVNMGGGAVYPFWGDVQVGAELRWHHIFSVQGSQLDVGLVNNIVPSVFVFYGF